jgi:hypothetical protein
LYEVCMDRVAGRFLWDTVEASCVKESADYASEYTVSVSLTIVRCVVVVMAIMHPRLVVGLRVLPLSTSSSHSVA